MIRSLLAAATATLAAASVALAAPAAAAPGAVDTAFGERGTVVLDTPVPGGSSDGTVLARQRTGTLVVSRRAPDHAVLLVRRLLTGGRWDATFGQRGTAAVDFGRPVLRTSARVLPDDRVLLLADLDTPSGQVEAGLALLRPDGTPDPAFGQGRPVVSTLGAAPLSDRHDQDAIDPTSALPTADGGFLVSADERRRTGDGDVLLAKFDRAGRPDPAFGAGGLRRVDLGGDEHGVALLDGPRGEVLAAGSSWRPERLDAVVARLRADGTVDPAFADGGTLRITVPDTDLSTSDAVVVDGALVLGGAAGARTSRGAFAARVSADGALDPGFGRGGLLLLDDPAETDEWLTLAPATDGSLLLGRHLGTGPFLSRLEKVVARTGAPVRRFGTDGSLDLGEFMLGSVVADHGGVLVSGHRADPWAPLGVVRRYEDDVRRVTRAHRAVRHSRAG
ncbi:NHL repeat-containing protein [Kineococcus indalonis]|uniref:hypothetical protein n=1 Tax=Kineococcus indalonis TaxID=2696566 RepID=UPI00141267EF|nr:hypothetical protein [Kineococcus indalonis]NAZ88251.1 hypothetical protein [Kineococcus indalonis]